MFAVLALQKVYFDIAFSSLVTWGELECGMECHSSPECRSFLFNQRTRQCHLSNATFRGDSKAVPRAEGIDYYRFVSSTAAPPGYRYEFILDRYYKLHTEELTWVEAKAACQAEGGVLAMPKTIAERDFYKSIMDSDLLQHDVFFGGEKSSGKWKWLDGTDVTDVKVGDSDNSHECLELERDNLMFESETCDRDKEHFICEHI